MKKLFAVMLFTAAVLFLMLPNLSWADDAAASLKPSAPCATVPMPRARATSLT